jgi:rSAM/selenodomain-associated transferase 1
MTPAAGCAVVAVVVFAKAPVAGYAKTRLAPTLGADGAACLAERLLVEATSQAIEASIGPVEICAAPDAAHPAFLALARRFGVALVGQGEGDLGLRMHRAFVRTLGKHRGAIIIGTDAPGLGARYLRDAARALATHDAVLGPAMDGGYTLLGLRRPDVALFDGIAWSTPRVLEQARERLARAGLSHAELAPLADVDEPADLRYVPRAWLQPRGKAR